ncbi:MAG: PPC domain-containing DNA-binding protein [Chryseosolibacter sp.]
MTPSHPGPPHSPANIYVIRLKPHEDLKRTLQEFSAKHQIKAGLIQTCVGSLRQYHLRFANQKEGKLKEGYFEIVSLTGTLSHDSVHLHICVSDEHGVTTGGHLLDRNLIYTTAEIAIAALPRLEFHRVFDPLSGYPELEIRQS